MNILRPSNNYVAGIFFPIGRPETGGTCQYASERCLRECYALNKCHDVTVDIPECEKREIYRFFVQQTKIHICNKILEEMDGLQAKVLSWFCSGDCMDNEIEKIYGVMLLLNEEGIIQNGFTRNVNLYQRIREDEILQHIVLTVESKSEKDTPEDIQGEFGLWAIPNYDKAKTELYRGTLAYAEDVGSCGFHNVSSHTFDGKEVRIATNCYGCYKEEIGCFISRK